MKKRTKKLKTNIAAAKKDIAKIFKEQCKNGAQAKSLEEHEATACGQFIGEQAKNSEQRGLHGTVAALRVLAQEDSEESRILVSKLVKYLSNREEIETQTQTDDEKARLIRQKCELDSKNVIKVSEALYALSYVHTGVYGTEALVKKLAAELIKAFKEDKGWSYFTDDDNGPELLPTAYAMLGLSAKGYSEADAAAKYISDQLKNKYLAKNAKQDIDADIMIDITCLYAINFKKARTDLIKQDENLKKIFYIIWGKLKSIVTEDLEQNVEYSHRKEKYYYVRIPWQLYLIDLTMRYEFKWAFSSSIVQKKLQNILSKVSKDGFFYPHSGRMISARTNAILFEMLSIIEKKLEYKNLFFLGITRDKFTDFLRAKKTRIGAFIILLILSFYIFHKWFQTGNISELGPELLGAFIVSLITIICKRW